MPEGGHRARVVGVRVGGGDDVGTSCVHCTVERERGGVRGTRALVERSLRVGEHEVTEPHAREVHLVRRGPERVGELGVPSAQMPGGALGVSEPPEQAERLDQSALAFVPHGSVVGHGPHPGPGPQ